MIYKVEFQVKGLHAARPEDAIQDDELKFEQGEFLPLPNVGDSVDYQYGGKSRPFKVVSRHFSYDFPGWCIVNIVVTDLSNEEMAARLKA